MKNENRLKEYGMVVMVSVAIGVGIALILPFLLLFYMFSGLK